MHMNFILSKLIRTIQCFLTLVVIAEQIFAQTWCNYYGEVPVGNMQYVYSPGYPKNYNGQQFDWKCRWLAECPQGYNCNLRCNIELPYSEACSQDHLLIARDGDPTFNGANIYCGMKQVEVRSVDNRISVDITIPYDENIVKAERNKIGKYLDLSFEFSQNWRMERPTIIPIVISTNGVVPKSLKKYLESLCLDVWLEGCMQKAVLLANARIV